MLKMPRKPGNGGTGEKCQPLHTPCQQWQIGIMTNYCMAWHPNMLVLGSCILASWVIAFASQPSRTYLDCYGGYAILDTSSKRGFLKRPQTEWSGMTSCPTATWPNDQIGPPPTTQWEYNGICPCCAQCALGTMHLSNTIKTSSASAANRSK